MFFFPVVDGMWGPWGNGPCSQALCAGTMARTRACNNPAPANGGKDCSTEEGGASDDAPCNTLLGDCPGW